MSEITSAVRPIIPCLPVETFRRNPLTMKYAINPKHIPSAIAIPAMNDNEIWSNSPPGARNKNTPPIHITGIPRSINTPEVPAMMSAHIKIIPATTRTIPAQLNGSILRPIAPSNNITPPVVPRMNPPGVIISKNIAIIPPDKRRYAISGLDTNWIICSVNDMLTLETVTSSSRLIFTDCEPFLTLLPDTALMSELMSPAMMSIAPSLSASSAVSDMLSTIIISAVSTLRPLS